MGALKDDYDEVLALTDPARLAMRQANALVELPNGMLTFPKRKVFSATDEDSDPTTTVHGEGG